MKANLSILVSLLFLASSFSYISGAEIKLKKDIFIKDLVVGAMAFSPDGKWLAVSGTEGAADFRRGKMRISSKGGICVLNMQKIKVKRCLAKGTWPGDVIFSQDNQRVIGIIDYSLKVWKVKKGKPKILSQNVQNVAFSFSGQYALLLKKDGILEAFDIDQNKKINEYEKMTEKVKPLCAGLEEFYTVYVKGKILQLKNLTNGQVSALGEWTKGDLNRVALSPDGKTLATGSTSGTVALWSLEDGKKLVENSMAANRINSLTFASDGTSLVYGGVGKALYLWRTGEEKVHINFGTHKLPILAVAVASDSRHFASSSFDGTVKIWEFK